MSHPITGKGNGYGVEFRELDRIIILPGARVVVINSCGGRPPPIKSPDIIRDSTPCPQCGRQSPK